MATGYGKNWLKLQKTVKQKRWKLEITLINYQLKAVIVQSC